MLDLRTFKLRSKYVYSPVTLKKKLSVLKEFDRFLKINKLPLDAHSVGLFMDYLMRSKLSPKSISTYMHDVFSYFDIMDIDIDERSIKRIKKRMPKGFTSSEAEYLEPEEVRKIIEGSPPIYKLIFTLMYRYGRRLSEVLSLKKSDVNLKSMTITFPILKKKTPETAVYKLDPDIADSLRYYMDSVIGNKLFPVSSRAVEIAFKRICKAVGVRPKGRKLRPHLLRHSCATTLRDLGVPLDIIGKHILRHSNVQTTYSYYLGVSNSMRESIPDLKEMLGE